MGGHAGRTPALLSLATERESVPPSYKCCNKKAVSWRRARRFARAMTRYDLLYEQIEEQIRYKPNNIIIKSKSADLDLDKFLPSKAYTSVYAFRNADLVANIRLASNSDDSS